MRGSYKDKNVLFPLMFPASGASSSSGGGGSGATESGVSWVLAWNGQSTPDVTEIPEGVTVSYNGTEYTGTLEASGDTQGKMYLVFSNSTETTDTYNMYVTIEDGSDLVWSALGSTGIDTSLVYTNESTSALVTMGDLRTRINAINNAGKHVFFDMHTFISGAYVCLITLTESGGTYYCVINDLLNDNIYATYTGYSLTDTISEFITDCTVKGGYRSIKIPANATTEDVRKLLESINAKGEHAFFDLSDMSAFSTYKQGYVCLIFCEYQSSSHFDTFHVIPLLGEYTYEIFVPDGNYSFQGQLTDNNKIGRQPMVINESVSASTGICKIEPGKYGWLGNRNGNNFAVYVYPDSTYGQYRLWKNRLPGIVAFTATADFTLTIETRTGCELVGDTVINCVSGKTYEICATYVGADDSNTCAISYRGW